MVVPNSGKWVYVGGVGGAAINVWLTSLEGRLGELGLQKEVDVLIERGFSRTEIVGQPKRVLPA